MGYLPKHLKVRRHKWSMRIIATAALSGAMFERQEAFPWRVRQRRVTPMWSVRYPDGQLSYALESKSAAAAVYLVWWFDKQGMWPRYRSATRYRSAK